MKFWKKWTLPIIIIISLSAVFYMYKKSENPKGIEVRVTPARIGNLSVYLSSSGTVLSNNKKDYFVYSPTKVEKVYVEVGDEVKQEELLIKLEVPDFSIQLKQASIQLDIARTTLESLKRQREQVEKFTSLPASSENLGELNMPSANIENQIKLQEKQVEIANLNVESIKDRMRTAQSQIKSDIRGIVTAANTAEGAIASPGMPVITVEDASSIKAVLNVSQYDAIKVRAGQEAVIKITGGEKQYKGVVSRINPTARKVVMGVSQETGIPVDVDILNPDSDIRIGFDVDVDIKTASKDGVLYIPYEAVITGKDGSDRVYVVEDGIARLRDIKVGIESDFHVEVVTGLREGENIILNPPPELHEGSTVRPRKEGGE